MITTFVVLLANPESEPESESSTILCFPFAMDDVMMLVVGVVVDDSGVVVVVVAGWRRSRLDRVEVEVEVEVELEEVATSR